MTETVKELIVKIKQEIKLCNSALALRTLEYLINKYENELAEKNRKIDLLLTANREITYSTKNREYNQQQLYKEDFYKNPYSTGSIDWILVDSSKYDKLPSKEDKKWVIL
ncbi:hypothetical protein [Spiroplasma endosymbiont of Ammophila pubescens]|uniref:hypothetical protein n=1 Tax=Spiroplasma endosymbiont of Ammophila pubescens TaxID=3066315 RepID=UPI0032B11FD2